MTKTLAILGLSLVLTACGGRDRCTAPPQFKPMTLSAMSLTDKADALGVPPSQVPDQPKSASSYNALIAGVNDNAQAESVYESFLARKNAALKQNYCIENEAYKARAMKDEMSTVAHAVMATCGGQDESAALAAVLKYRNCALGN